jgi:hypothetical protein
MNGIAQGTVNNEGGTFLGLCRLCRRESWWIDTITGVEPGFWVVECGEWKAKGPNLLVES